MGLLCVGAHSGGQRSRVKMRGMQSRELVMRGAIFALFPALQAVSLWARYTLYLPGFCIAACVSGAELLEVPSSVQREPQSKKRTWSHGNAHNITAGFYACAA